MILGVVGIHDVALSRVDGYHPPCCLLLILDTASIGLPFRFDGPVEVEAHADTVCVDLVPKSLSSAEPVIAEDLPPQLLFALAAATTLLPDELSDLLGKMASLIQVGEDLCEDGVVNSQVVALDLAHGCQGELGSLAFLALELEDVLVVPHHHWDVPLEAG